MNCDLLGDLAAQLDQPKDDPWILKIDSWPCESAYELSHLILNIHYANACRNLCKL